MASTRPFLKRDRTLYGLSSRTQGLIKTYLQTVSLPITYGFCQSTITEGLLEEDVLMLNSTREREIVPSLLTYGSRVENEDHCLS